MRRGGDRPHPFFFRIDPVLIEGYYTAVRMTTMSTRATIPVLILLLFSLVFPAGPAGALQRQTGTKPLSPLVVTIRPVQQGLTSSAIKPGDVVQLEVAALSHVGISKADLKVTFTGGAKLVGGDDRWSGPMEKGKEAVLTITVSTPMSGLGEVKAMLSSGGFHAGAQFSLGPESKSKTGTPGEKKRTKIKDSKELDIIEYRQ